MNNHEAIALLKTLCHTCDLFPKCVHEKPECFQAIDLAISALQAQDVPDINVGKIDRYGYIGIETLLNFCENSKDHAVTPNDFMRMNRVRVPERTKGKWIEYDSDEDKYDVIKCPCCKHTFTVDTYHWTDIGFVKDDFKFCPNCGAKLNGGEQE